MMAIANSRDIFSHGMRELYDAEHRLRSGHREMLLHASDYGLQGIIKTHLEEAERRINTLEDAFDRLGRSPERATSEQARGLMSGVGETMREGRLGAVRDYLIGDALVKADRFEMACYRSMISVSRFMDHGEVADLLEGDLRSEESVNDTEQNVRGLLQKIHATENPGFLQRITGQDFR